MIITGTKAVSELGGPMNPSADGPSHPSTPTIHVIEMTSPDSESSMSAGERVKTRSSTAMSTNASIIRGAIPSSVAFSYSATMISGERDLALSGPSDSIASSLIRVSATRTLSSPVLTSWKLPTAIWVPSTSVPVTAPRVSPIPGAFRTESTCACVTVRRSLTCRTALNREEGAKSGSTGVNISPISGWLAMSASRASI